MSPRRATFLHVLAGLLFGLGMHTYIAYRVSPALVLLVMAYYWLLAKRGGWQGNRSATSFVLSSIVVFAPLGYYFLVHKGSFFGHAGHITVWRSGSAIKNLARITMQTLAMFNILGDTNWRHNIAGALEACLAGGSIFLAQPVCSFLHSAGLGIPDAKWKTQLSRRMAEVSRK